MDRLDPSCSPFIDNACFPSTIFGPDTYVRRILRDGCNVLLLLLLLFQDSVICHDLIGGDIADYYAEAASDHKIDKFCRVHNKIADKYFTEFVRNNISVYLSQDFMQNVFDLVSSTFLI